MFFGCCLCLTTSLCSRGSCRGRPLVDSLHVCPGPLRWRPWSLSPAPSLPWSLVCCSRAGKRAGIYDRPSTFAVSVSSGNAMRTHVLGYNTMRPDTFFQMLAIGSVRHCSSSFSAGSSTARTREDASKYEPLGITFNQKLSCGSPALASLRHVGSAKRPSYFQHFCKGKPTYMNAPIDVYGHKDEKGMLCQKLH